MVKLMDNFKVKCLGDNYLADEPILFIGDTSIYNDIGGEWCFVKGGSLTNSGRVYLNEMELAYPIPERPLYSLYEDEVPLGMNENSDKSMLPPHYNYEPKPHYEGDGVHNILELERLLRNFSTYAHQQLIIKGQLINKIIKSGHLN